jgi:hypothetical protein
MRPQLPWSTQVHKVRFSVVLNAGEIEPGLVAHHWLVRGTNTGTGEDGSEPNKLDVYVTLISFLQWLTLQGMATLFTSFVESACSFCSMRKHHPSRIAFLLSLFERRDALNRARFSSKSRDDLNAFSKTRFRVRSSGVDSARAQ